MDNNWIWLKNNIDDIYERIEKAAGISGRNIADITLVAVTKKIQPETINQSLAFGVRSIGENRVQEARAKFPELHLDGVTRHLIGHLQSNKVGQALELFDLIHSVDSVSLMEAIDKRAGMTGRVARILIEVNVSGEVTKHGIEPGKLESMIEAAERMKHIFVEGLMTVAPIVDDPDEARPVFASLRELRERYEKGLPANVSLKYLSMGMSSDFEAAISEGANYVRIGSAIYSPI